MGEAPLALMFLGVMSSVYYAKRDVYNVVRHLLSICVIVKIGGANCQSGLKHDVINMA